ncbi:hypothetical protein ACFPRL_29595 [Pseudoclavibacter helvolus]
MTIRLCSAAISKRSARLSASFSLCPTSSPASPACTSCSTTSCAIPRFPRDPGCASTGTPPARRISLTASNGLGA